MKFYILSNFTDISLSIPWRDFSNIDATQTKRSMDWFCFYLQFISIVVLVNTWVSQWTLNRNLLCSGESRCCQRLQVPITDCYSIDFSKQIDEVVCWCLQKRPSVLKVLQKHYSESVNPQQILAIDTSTRVEVRLQLVNSRSLVRWVRAHNECRAIPLCIALCFVS